MKRYFGKYKDQDIYLYTIENDKLKVEVSSLGATLVSLIYKPLNRDICLGYEDAETYADSHGSNMGATIGRCANRIAKGRFSLNGEEYHLTINNGPNTLHSGNENLANRVYDVHETEDALTLEALSEDGSDGFPGTLKVKIRYRLEDDSLVYAYEGTSDKDTLFNITNHAYFNLDGPSSTTILDHELYIPTDYVGLVDSNGLATDGILDVKNTAFDFKKFKKIRDNLALGHDNINTAKGYDHPYIFNKDKGELKAIFRNNDLALEVSSDLPDMHFYTANYLDGEVKGKNGNYYIAKGGACFECEYYPNAINYTLFKKPILKANELKSHYIRYRLSERKN